MKILHVIVSLKVVGGAELMLSRMVEFSHKREGISYTVVCLTEMGELGLKLQKVGVKMYELNIKDFKSFIFAFFRLVQLVKLLKPDVIQTWMYHADLFGGIAGRLGGSKNIFWNIRNTQIPQKSLSATKFVIIICSILSRLIPKRIICCAESAFKSHILLGYKKSIMVVIPNGYRVENYLSSKKKIKNLRKKLGIPEKSFIVGVVGRYDPLKGFDTLIEASNIVERYTKKKFIYLLVGRGINEDNLELRRLINKAKDVRFQLMGEQKNVLEIMALMDIYCLSSKAEGFPNVVAEAMLMETPCVVTDVGDAKKIVGKYGKVVEPNNPSKLASAIIEMHQFSKKELKNLGKKARAQIEKNYNIQFVMQKYLDQYRHRINHGKK